MKRAIIILVSVCSLAGCRASGPPYGPWGTGPQRVPSQPTGSIGPAINAQPYYQSAPPQQFGVPNTLGATTIPANPYANGTFPYNNGGLQVAPTNQFGAPPYATAPSIQLPTSSLNTPGVITMPQIPAGTSVSLPPAPTTNGPTTVNGWRSPQPVIQRANAQLPNSYNQVPVPQLNDRTATPTLSPSLGAVSAGPGQSVLVQGPIRVVEPASSRPVPSVAIHPMPVNDATLAVTEPRAFRAPDRLTEITNSPRARQSVATIQPFQASRGFIAAPAPTPRFDSSQWQSTTTRFSRAP